MVAVFLAVVLLLSGVVLGNSWLEARREVCIEGPFGWSSLTFTRRYRSDSTLGRLAKLVVGPDKVATEYHLVSAGLWFLMYLSALPLAILYGMLVKVILVPVLVDVSAVIVACFVLTMNVEDYLWFLIHPYYGPDRYSAEYVPWIQHYVAGLQVSYLWSVGGVTILVALSAIATRMYLALLLWFCVLTVVILCTALIKRHQRKIPRKELQKYWWQSCRYVVIARCPFPIESRPPFLEPVAWVMDGSAFARALVEGGLTRI